MSDSATPWTAAHQASPSITNSRSLLKLMSIGSMMPSNHLIFCCPLLLLPSIFPSIRVFSNESALCIRWPKYWTLSNNGKGCLAGTFRFSARGCVHHAAASDPLSLPGAAVLRATLQSRVSSSSPTAKGSPCFFSKASTPVRPPPRTAIPATS